MHLLHCIKVWLDVILEYANSVWNPHRQGQIKDLEKVQMRATKLLGYDSQAYVL